MGERRTITAGAELDQHLTALAGIGLDAWPTRPTDVPCEGALLLRCNYVWLQCQRLLESSAATGQEALRCGPLNSW
ncbi:hypothetical protein [Tahibacter amnicola]|uniref:Uncharacterized protein n=1 Tax=Tahibacter amnicola TaxID=2976241 RepID=A0ABY6BA92_9GAMM|nr:hypothetical protein [Tahibacter amnicola]UXI66981.1 hypothetical protein N4264_19835 [Tahibacter amnicola]